MMEMTSSNNSGRALVASPCAACKMLRRRCVAEKCVLAPYFPPNDPHKFITAHRVFGASNIIKLLQDLPMDRRADAVSSMVYEASARLRDPVYGCAGTICQLQQQLCQLQSDLATAQAELLNMHLRQANLLAFITGSVDRGLELTVEPFSPTNRRIGTDHHQHQQQKALAATANHDDPVDLWEPLWK
eukprot:Gb_20676 [translate_table: standard]